MAINNFINGRFVGLLVAKLWIPGLIASVIFSASQVVANEPWAIIGNWTLSLWQARYGVLSLLLAILVLACIPSKNRARHILSSLLAIQIFLVGYFVSPVFPK